MKLLDNIVHSWNLFSRYASGSKGIICVQKLVFILITIYQILVSPYILTLLFDAVTAGSWIYIVQTGLWSAGLIFFFFFLCYINNVYMDLYSFRINFIINSSLCKFLFQLPFDRISADHDDADILTRFESGSWAIDGTFTFITLVFANIIGLVGLLFLAGSTSIPLLLLSAVTVVVFLLVTKFEAKAKKRYEIIKQQLKSENETMASQIASLPCFLNMYRAWDWQKEAYHNKREALWQNEWKSERLSILLSASIEFLTCFLRGVLGLVFFPLRAAGLIGDAVIATSLSIYDSLRGVISGFSFPFIRLTECAVQVNRLEEVTTDFPTDCYLPDNLIGEAAIDVRDLCYRVSDDRFILMDIALRVEKGEKVALIGCNGSGKSTLLKCICGVNTPNVGEIHIRGSANILNGLARKNEFRRSEIGYIPSATYLYTGSARENIQMNTDDNEDNKIAHSTEQAGLTGMEGKEVLSSSVMELSGGQGQRVSIARTLAHSASILLADEPFSGVQSRVGDMILRNILNAAETVVVVTHSPEHLALFDRIILMENGRVAAQGKLEALQGRTEFIKWRGEVSAL